MSEPIVMENHELTLEVEIAAKGEKRPRIKVSPLSVSANMPVEELLKRADELAIGGLRILKERFDAEMK
jgi:hypothetical protein